MSDIHKQSYSIMLIDDSEEDLVLLKRILTKRSFKVTTCTSGLDALKLAEQDPPDLFFLDIDMPGMNGYEVCQLIQKNEKLKFVPVVFLSALVSPLDKVKGFDVGGIDYISKPFQFDEVYARINTHLRIHSLLKAQYKQIEKNYINLKELESLRDTLVHMIIHDMRTPLSVMSGYLGIVQKDIETNRISERTNRGLSDVIHSTESLIEMTSAILDVNKMESGRIELHPSKFDLAQAIGNAVSKSYLSDEMATFTQAFPDKAVIVEADQTYIERVVQNLLSNAFKFTNKKNGLVHLSVEEKNDLIRLSVRDNGLGFPSELKNAIFDKFVTGDAKLKGSRYSIGLGLTFCKMAVEAHGGRIGAENLAEGGVVLWFEIPKCAIKK